jgi:hypothetical protein
MQENGMDVDSDVSGDDGGLEQGEFCVFAHFSMLSIA